MFIRQMCWMDVFIKKEHFSLNKGYMIQNTKNCYETLLGTRHVYVQKPRMLLLLCKPLVLRHINR